MPDTGDSGQDTVTTSKSRIEDLHAPGFNILGGGRDQMCDLGDLIS